MDGRKTPLRDIWYGRKVMLVFVPDLGCITSQIQLAILREHEERLAASGITVCVITPVSRTLAWTYYYVVSDFFLTKPQKLSVALLNQEYQRAEAVLNMRVREEEAENARKLREQEDDIMYETWRNSGQNYEHVMTKRYRQEFVPPNRNLDDVPTRAREGVYPHSIKRRGLTRRLRFLLKRVKRQFGKKGVRRFKKNFRIRSVRKFRMRLRIKSGRLNRKREKRGRNLDIIKKKERQFSKRNQRSRVLPQWFLYHQQQHATLSKIQHDLDVLKSKGEKQDGSSSPSEDGDGTNNQSTSTSSASSTSDSTSSTPSNSEPAQAEAEKEKVVEFVQMSEEPFREFEQIVLSSTTASPRTLPKTQYELNMEERANQDDEAVEQALQIQLKKGEPIESVITPSTKPAPFTMDDIVAFPTMESHPKYQQYKANPDSFPKIQRTPLASYADSASLSSKPVISSQFYAETDTDKNTNQQKDSTQTNANSNNGSSNNNNNNNNNTTKATSDDSTQNKDQNSGTEPPSDNKEQEAEDPFKKFNYWAKRPVFRPKKHKTEFDSTSKLKLASWAGLREALFDLRDWAFMVKRENLHPKLPKTFATEIYSDMEFKSYFAFECIRSPTAWLKETWQWRHLIRKYRLREGAPMGDPYIMGGLFVIDNGQVIYSFRSRAKGDFANMEDVLFALENKNSAKKEEKPTRAEDL